MLKSEDWINKSLGSKNNLIGRRIIVFWICLKGKVHLGICGYERNENIWKEQFSGRILALTTLLCDYFFMIPSKFCLPEVNHLQRLEEYTLINSKAGGLDTLLLLYFYSCEAWRKAQGSGKRYMLNILLMNLNNGKCNDFDIDYIKIVQHVKNTISKPCIYLSCVDVWFSHQTEDIFYFSLFFILP